MFSESYYKKIDIRYFLDFYGWYLDADREHACLIMDHIKNQLTAKKIEPRGTIFMVRNSGSEKAITFLKDGKLGHLRILEIEKSTSELASQTFEINNKAYFEKISSTVYLKIVTRKTQGRMMKFFTFFMDFFF